MSTSTFVLVLVIVSLIAAGIALIRSHFTSEVALAVVLTDIALVLWMRL
jgi:hypothetical protein